MSAAAHHRWQVLALELRVAEVCGEAGASADRATADLEVPDVFVVAVGVVEHPEVDAVAAGADAGTSAAWLYRSVGPRCGGRGPIRGPN